MPGGAFAKKRKLVGISTESAAAGCCSLSAKGHVFAMECTMETLSNPDMRRKRRERATHQAFDSFRPHGEYAMQVLEVAAKFYNLPGVELPGFILLSIGLCDVLDAQDGRASQRVRHPNWQQIHR